MQPAFMLQELEVGLLQAPLPWRLHPEPSQELWVLS